MEPAPAGMKRFMVKSKFGVGRDFEVLDENEQGPTSWTGSSVCVPPPRSRMPRERSSTRFAAT